MDGQTIGQLILLATTIAGFLFQAYQLKRKERLDARQREWDLEDRRLAREDAELAKAQLAKKVEESAHVVRKATDKQTETIVSKIDENTELSRVAFQEANNVNAKIAAVAGLFDSVNLRVKLPEMQDIKDTVEDTNARVRGIEENANDKT